MRTQLRWSFDDPAIVDVLGDHEKRRRTFRPDRVCAMPRCNTFLSIYNEGSLCARHEIALQKLPGHLERSSVDKLTVRRGQGATTSGRRTHSMREQEQSRLLS